MKQKNSLFIKYMLTYMSVSIVTIVLFGVFLYTHNIKAARSSAIAKYKTTLASTCSTVDNQLSRTYDLSVILQASKAEEEIRCLPSPISPGSVSSINTFSAELQPYSYTSSFINDLILYFSRSELFVSSKSVGLYADIFYDVILGYQDMDYNQWREKMKNSQFMNFHSYRDAKTGEVYVDILQDLPYRSDQSKATMIVRIDTSKLTTGLDVLMQNGVIVLLSDYNGNIVYKSGQVSFNTAQIDMGMFTDGQTVSLDNRNYFIIAKKMQSVQWNYMILVPDQLLLEEERRVLTTIFIHFLAILVTGAVMAIAFSFYNMIPVKKLVKALSLNTDYKMLSNENEYSTLDYNIQNLIRNNQNLKKEMERRIEYGKTSFIERLLKGSFTSSEECSTTAKYSGVIMEHQYYVLAIFELIGYNSEIHAEFLEEMDMTSMVITDFIQNQVEQDVLVHKADFNRIALIFCMDHPYQPEKIYDNILMLIDSTMKKLNIKLRCAISNEIPDVNFISAANYALVRQLQETDALTSGSIVSMNSKDITMESYFYPLDIENRLLNYILSGNEQEAKNTLVFLFTQNEEEYKITMPCTVYFIYALKCTLIRAKNEIEMSDTEKNNRFDYIIYLEKKFDLDIQLIRFFEIIELLCKTVNDKKTMKNAKIIDSINLYIEENYYDDQLGLNIIASKFMLTENYLSYFYKSQTGKNISTTIETVRLNEAVKMIKNGGKTIKDIASLVGYTNLNTFYKAFKRYYGVSPKGYHDRILNIS